MSDEARDLLVHGVAAARAGDKDEAHFYLEWVLRTDADFDEQADAWYWLSTLSGDANEKREYLQNVLAIMPNYPEARRDLAIVDGRLDPGQVLPETRRDIAPLVPSSVVQSDKVKRFKCPKCGGMTVFQPGIAALACQFCGYRPGNPTIPEPTANGSPNQDWIAAIYTRKGHIWQLPVARSLRCQGCGANVTLSPATVSVSCPFCGSPYLALDNTARQLIQPDGILPFKYERGAALQRFANWLSSQQFAPADLVSQAQPEPPRPVYLPVWHFNLSGEVLWHAVIIEEEYAKPVPVRTDGAVPLLFNDVLVSGSKSPGTERVSALNFALEDAVAYDEKYLADWPAEIYGISLSDAAVLAHEQAFKRSQSHARAQVAAIPDVEEIEVDHVEIQILSYKHMLVPVWLCDYGYKGQSYSAVMDGNGGSVTGDVPRAGVNRLLSRIFTPG